jgi:hypothetical protein
MKHDWRQAVDSYYVCARCRAVKADDLAGVTWYAPKPTGACIAWSTSEPPCGQARAKEAPPM